MSTQSLIKGTGQFLRDAAPQPQAAVPTTRDISTGSLAGAVSVLLVWIVHDLLGVSMPPEVAAALATVAGFAVARMFRY